MDAAQSRENALRNRLDCALVNLRSAHNELAFLRADRERIRNERDLAEVRMIDAEAMLADAREVTVTLRFVG